jgi:hypothetical protein
MTVVVDINKRKKRQRASRDLVSIDKSSGAGRFYVRMQREIEHDLGGRPRLSRIELELVNAFCAGATQLQYMNHQILLGEGGEIDLAGFSQLASTMLRIGSRLGIHRVPRDVTPSLQDIIDQQQDSHDDDATVAVD